MENKNVKYKFLRLLLSFLWPLVAALSLFSMILVYTFLVYFFFSEGYLILPFLMSLALLSKLIAIIKAFEQLKRKKSNDSGSLLTHFPSKSLKIFKSGTSMVLIIRHLVQSRRGGWTRRS